jgi:hypothetical protein
MSERRPWTKQESDRLWAAVKDAPSFEEAYARAAKACPQREISKDSIWDRLKRMGKPTLTEIIAKNAPLQPTDHLEKFRKQDVIAGLKAELAKMVAELDDRQKKLDAFQKLAGVRPLKPITEPKRVGATQRRGTAVMLCSDWHIEERVDPRTVNDLNRWNLDLAEKAIESLADSFVWMTKDSRFDVREVLIAIIGDLFSGYIHEELQEGNFLSPVQAVVWLIPRIEKMLRTIAANLPSVSRFIIPCNDGNHGRLTKKMRHGTRTANSLEWLLYWNLAARMKDDERFEFQIAEGIWNYVDLYGKTHGFAHGDIYRYQGGVGGLLIPVRRGLNEDRKYLNYDADCGPEARPARRLDHVSIGHFHTRMDLDEGLSVNGSLIGINPYSMANHFPPEAPKQSFYMVDSRRGKCLSAPIWLPRRGASNEDRVKDK